jgi:hypothetical protein
MKYYIYISDAKVDMLLPQVPHEAKKKIASELGFDLKLLKASRKTETESDENRISRLETVLSFIREYGNLGTVDKPDDFIEDTQSMAYGPTSWESAPVVYFTGKTKKTLFGLAGSPHHMVGNGLQSSPTWPSGSGLNFLIHWLYAKAENKEDMYPARKAFWGMGFLHDEANRLSSPQQRLEFMAKRLLFESKGEYTEDRKRILLATPLYVAMTN